MPSPRDLFAVEVEECLRSMQVVIGVKPVSNEYALEVTTASGEHLIGLDNVFLETRDLSGEERRRRIGGLCAALESMADAEYSWDTLQSKLVPVLRGATYALAEFARLGKRPEGLVRRPFLPFLDAIVAIDRPDSVELATEEMLALWRLDADALFAHADRCLTQQVGTELRLYDEKDGPLWIVSSRDGYESSLLLMRGWLAAFSERVEGRPIAIAPERSTLLVGGARRIALVERLLGMAEREFTASTRRLSPALYTVSDEGTVVPYLEAGQEQVSERLRRAHERLALHEYDAQKNILEQFVDIRPDDDDAFIASYRPLTRKGRATSFAVWTKGVPTYLPRTERVILAAPGETPEQVEVPFAAIQDRLDPVPWLHPDRFAAKMFPSAAEMKAFANRDADK